MLPLKCAKLNFFIKKKKKLQNFKKVSYFHKKFCSPIFNENIKNKKSKFKTKSSKTVESILSYFIDVKKNRVTSKRV